MRPLLLVLALLVVSALPVAAQWSLGPQVGGLGVGGSVTRTTLLGFVSFSGEYSFAPVGATVVNLEGVEYRLEPTVSGGAAFINLHPLRGNFSVGAGYLFGGYQADAGLPADAGAYVLDGMTYTVDAYGALTGVFELKGPVPAFMIGWRGAGFNFGLGIALTEAAVSLAASGPQSGEPGFVAGLERERLDLVNALNIELLGLSGIPLVRLGWELSL
ncbi:MAG: hypothetical protein ACI80V_000063 [Rhodothermales bacterium]|jgi:hypothetical protein